MSLLSLSASTRARISRGTTLMEVLVVIVIFLVGILAIVQIFPRGFQLLMATRNNSMSSALARGEVERLKSAPDQLPDMILPAYLLGNVYVADPDYSPNTTDSVGNVLLPNGILQRDGNTLGPWQLFTGPNGMKRIVGEGRRVPAPRAVGTGGAYYGGLLLLQFGPIDFRPTNAQQAPSVSVYGNDLVPYFRDIQPLESFVDGQYFVRDANTSAITLRLPTGPTTRFYRVAFSAYVQNGPNYVKRDYIDVQRVKVDAGVPDAQGRYPLYDQPVQGLIADTLGTVDLNTLAVQRAYTQLAKADTFSGVDPYEFKLLDTNIGVLLFNSLANSTYIDKPSGREPLLARVNYDVYDWRILKDDFRLGRSSGVQQYKLSIGSLKVAGNVGIDGLKETNIPLLESAPSNPVYSDTSAADEARANNLVIIDKETGGVVMERLPSDASPPNPAADPLIVVSKGSGVITFRDADSNITNGTQGKLLLADGTVMDVALENRALRAMYRVRNEFSVQVLKAAARYTLSSDGPPTVGQYAFGSAPTRIYFPRMDAGRKVNLGEINYYAGSDPRQIFGQDLIIRFQQGDNLPSVDIQEVDSGATAFNFTSGAAIRGVKGASVAVRVLWNPDFFFLTSIGTENMSRLNKWGQGYRRSTNETFLERGEVIR
ncbi:MAG: hypothetical protein ACAH95_17440 [Fimbriimonas sp.]